MGKYKQRPQWVDVRCSLMPLHPFHVSQNARVELQLQKI